MIHLVCGSTGAGKTTYAVGLCRDLGGLHFSIDDWMVGLFGPDQADRPDWNWIAARLARCEHRILDIALQAAGKGMPSVLDLGLQQAEQRGRVASRVSAAGWAPRLHFLDVDAETRWQRVETRNRERGPTYRLAVTRPMFDFIETLWQPPGPSEMDALDGVRIAT